MNSDKVRERSEQLRGYGSDRNLESEFFPPVNPPDSDGESYTFPSDAELLSDNNIDRWLLFLGGWKSYTSYRVSQLEAELAVLSEGFDVMLQIQGAELDESSTKRLLKDSIKGKVLNDDPSLQALKMRIAIKQGQLKILRGRYYMYDHQFDTISRIVTRRGQDRVRP